MMRGMETRIHEIAPDIFRLSTLVPDVAPPAGFTFNQILIRDDEPFLMHTGMRALFPLVSDAIGSVLGGVDRLRWISFAHVEADECGAMNQLLAVAPQAQVVHGGLACMVSLNDLADRPPVVAGDDPIDIGGHRLRFLPTPHVPHNWESGLWFDETTRTLLAGDLFTAIGDGAPIVDTDLVETAIVGEEIFHATSIGAATVPTLQGLAELAPTTLATMHGSSYTGDGAVQLLRLADYYDKALANA
jgi:flavorubredoxin